MPVTNETLSKLLDGLYAAAANPDLWNPFLRRLAQITRAESAGLVWHDAGVHIISHSWEIDPEMARLHQEHYHSVDVWGLRGASLPSGSVRSSQSLCPPAELKTTEVYNDFMVRFGIEHGLFAVVEQNSGPRGGAVSLFRSSASPEFETDAEEMLRLLAGHIKQAFRLYREFSDLKGSVGRTGNRTEPASIGHHPPGSEGASCQHESRRVCGGIGKRRATGNPKWAAGGATR